MNHIYRIVFNRSLGIYQCVCEFAKACGKSSGKIFKVGVLAGAMASGSAFALDINEDKHYTTSSDRAEPINIATTKGSHVTVTVSGKDVVRSMSASGAYDSNNPHKDRQWIGVGQYGTGILNIENGATVRSADSILLGVMGDKVNRVAHGHGTVNLSGESKLQADIYLMVGDGGVGTLNVNSGSKVNARDIWISSTNHGAGSTINIEGAGQREDHKSQVNAFTITIGDEGDGTVNIKNDGMISANRLIIGEQATGNLNVSSGGNVAVNNIEKGSNGKANLVLNGADIKVEQGNQDNFFKGFTSTDSITINNGLEFNTNGHDVTINPNAVFTGNRGKFTTNGGGFEKTGEGNLTISENTLKNTKGDIAIEKGTLKLNGNFKFNDGESLNIGIDDESTYGKFHVTGNLDVSKGALNVYAFDLIKALLADPNNTTTFNDMVKAGTLTGKFTSFKVLDKDGNPIASNLDTEYTDNTINLVTKPATVTPPVTPPVITLPAPPTTTLFTDAVVNNNTSSASNVAGVLDKAVSSPNSSLGKTLVALQTVAKLDDKQLSQIAQNLQPAINAQAPTVINEQHNLATTAVTDRIFTTRADITQGSDAGGRSLFKRSDNLSNSVWLQAVGQKHKADSRGGFAGFDGNSHGFVVGTDGMASDDLRLGVALGHSDSDIDSTGTSVRQNLQTKLTQAYVYGDYSLSDDTNVNGFVGYGRANIETERDINVANILTGKAKADYDAKITQLGIGVDHRIGTINDHFSPFAQLRYTRLASDSYRETSSEMPAFAVNVGKNSENIVRATVGVHFAKPIKDNTQLIGSVAGHLENDHRPTINASFNGLSDVSFNQTAQKNDKFLGSLGLGVRHQLSATTEISGQYQGEFSKNTNTNGGVVAIKWKF